MVTQQKIPGLNGDDMTNNTKHNILDSHSILNRAVLAAMLGYSHDGDRNIYKALGYDVSISKDQYFSQYSRQDLAKAIINRPVNMTWQGKLEVSEGQDDEETTFEKQYRQLSKRLKLKSKFKRLDKLSLLGEYGVLLLGLSDCRSRDDWAKPVSGNKLKLNYIKPYSQINVDIDEYVSDPGDPRYGLPLFYEIDMARTNEKGNLPIKVHYSRLIHVTGELLESETHGIPELQAGWNRLKDMEKILGGSAEMFWLGARPGYQFDVKEGKNLHQGDWDDLKSQVDEYEHNIRRLLRTKGVDINALSPQVQDPSNHIDSQLQALSAVYEIPRRILTGSERGELSSGQDRTEWLEKIQNRREEQTEEQIVRPFVDFCVKYGVIAPPQGEDYEVVWSDLFAPSEKDKAEVGEIRAKALEAYGKIPGLQEIIPIEFFVDSFLGLPQSDVDKIKEALDQMQQQEQQRGPTSEEEEIIEKET